MKSYETILTETIGVCTGLIDDPGEVRCVMLAGVLAFNEKRKLRFKGQ